MKHYRGIRTHSGCTVLVGEARNPGPAAKPRPLRFDRKQSDGLEWGYGGTGPSELASALLADVIGLRPDPVLAQRFKWAVVSRLPRAGWYLLEEEIRDWIDTGKEPALVRDVLDRRHFCRHTGPYISGPHSGLYHCGLKLEKICPSPETGMNGYGILCQDFAPPEPGELEHDAAVVEAERAEGSTSWHDGIREGAES